MKCRFKGIRLSALPYAKGFSLPEVMAAVTILAIISTSVWVVINRCMASAADSVLRMQAFEVARENMEKLLVSDLVAEQVEYGSSEEYPDIEWQTVVEMFYEPLTSRAWIRAVCSAEYTDIAGDLQTVELTHWLTDLTKEQLIRIMKERKEALTAEQIAETEEEAAAYAGVDERTIQQWIENGMPTTEDGYFIKDELDLYKETDGNPTIVDRKQQIEKLAESGKRDLGGPGPEESFGPEESSGPEKGPRPEKGSRPEEGPEPVVQEPEPEPVEPRSQDLICGHTIEELNQMSFDEVWQILTNCEEF